MNTVVKKSLISTGILATLIYLISQLFDFHNITHQAGHTHDPCNGCNKQIDKTDIIERNYLYHNVVSGATIPAFNTREVKIEWEKMRFDWFIINRYCANIASVKITDLDVTIDVAYDLCRRPLFGDCEDCHEHLSNRPKFPSVASMTLKPSGLTIEGELTSPHLFGNIYKDQNEWGLIKMGEGDFVYFLNTKNTPLEIGKKVNFRLEQFSIDYDGKTHFFNLAFDVLTR
jgi:hypothetical protein